MFKYMFFRMDPNPFLRHTFWTVGIGMTFSWLTQLGIHPGAIQRFVALPTYGKAKKSLIYFILGMGVVKILTGTVGMLIYAKYKDCDPITANVSVYNLNYREEYDIRIHLKQLTRYFSMSKIVKISFHIS